MADSTGTVIGRHRLTEQPGRGGVAEFRARFQEAQALVLGESSPSEGPATLQERSTRRRSGTTPMTNEGGLS